MATPSETPRGPQKNCGTDFHGVAASTNSTTMTSIGEYLLKISPSVAALSHQKKNKKNRTRTKT